MLSLFLGALHQTSTGEGVPLDLPLLNVYNVKRSLSACSLSGPSQSSAVHVSSLLQSRGVNLWNSLPVQLCNPDITYGLFRRQLKGHLFRDAWTRRSVTSDMRRLRRTLTYSLTWLICTIQLFAVAALHQGTPGQMTSWMEHPLPWLMSWLEDQPPWLRPAYCFASVIVWTENNITISDRFTFVLFW